MAETRKNGTREGLQILNIQLEPRPETPFYYVNYLSVASSSHEFVIGAVRVPIPLAADRMEQVKKGGRLVLEPTLQLIVPPIVAKGLIKALTEQVGKYEAQFGKIFAGVQ